MRDFLRAQGTVEALELAAWAKDLDALSAKGRYFFSTTRCFFAVSKAAAEDEQSPAPTR